MDKIKVAIKVRPLIERENAEGCGVCWNVSENCMWRKPKGDLYRFDHVFGMETSNCDIFETVATPIINAAVHGFNGTIFAYGQTSSGKTHTMMGTPTEPGIIPLAIKQMFEAISSDSPNRQFLLRASYIEIYNEKINDLLSKKCNLKLREESGQVVVVDLSEEVIHTPDKLFLLMKRGEKVRRIAETNMNERSSRSHTIFRIIIESSDTEDRDGAIQVSHLNLVDLAGSERVEQTGSTGDRLKEGCAINRSLFTLGLVIAQLTEGDEHVCYRDSKLTRILQSSIGGNALTAIVCTVTPAAVEETANTLSFASRAKNIKNKPQINEVLTEAALLKRYTRKIKELEEELERAKHVAPEMSEMESKLFEERNRNEMLETRISRLKENVINVCIDKPQSEVSNSFRRRTWCAPRMSSYRTSIFKPLKSNLPSISESSDINVPSQSWHSFDVSLDASCSELTFQTPIEEFELQLLESEKASNSFDFNFPELETVTIRRQKKVNFSIPENEQFTCSVAVQTDFSLLVDNSKSAMETPPQVLRERVSFYQKEYDELLDYTRLEKKTCPDFYANYGCNSTSKPLHGEPESWQTSSLLSSTGSELSEESIPNEMLLDTSQQGQQSVTQLQQLISKLTENLRTKESEIICLQKANERKKSFESETEEITMELSHLASENNALKQALSLKNKEFQEQLTSLQEQYLPVTEKICDLHLLLTKENTSHQEVIQVMDEDNMENMSAPEQNSTKISNLIKWLETIASKFVSLEEKTKIDQFYKNEHNTEPSFKHNVTGNEERLSEFLKTRESGECYYPQLAEAEEDISSNKQLAILQQEKAVLKEKQESEQQSLNTELAILPKETYSLQDSLSPQIDSYQKLQNCEEKNRLLHQDLEIAMRRIDMLEEENANLKTSLESELDMLNAEIASLNETNETLKHEITEKGKKLLEFEGVIEIEENCFAKLKVAENEMKLLHDEIATWKEQVDVLKEEKDVLKEKLESQLQSLNAELTVLKTEKDLLELSYSQKIDTLHQKLQVDGEELKSLVEELDEGNKQFRSLEQDKCNVEEVLRCKLELLTVENTSLKELNTRLKLEIAEREKKLLDNLKVKENEVKVIEEELKTVHEEIASMKKQLSIFEQEKGVLTEKLESQEKSLNTELTMLRKEKDELQLYSSQQIKLLHEDINTAKKQVTTLEEENLNLRTSLEIEVDMLNAEIASLNETNNILKCEFSEKEKNLLELAEKKGNEENYYGNLKVAESEMKLLSDEIATWKEQVDVLKEEKDVLKEKLESQLQSLNAELTVLKTEKDLLELSYSQKIDTLHQKLQVDGEELKSLVEELDEGKKQFRSLEQDKCNVEEVLRCKLELLTVENTSLKELNTRLKLEIAEREKKLLDNLKVKENEVKVIEEELKTVHEEIASMKKQLSIFEQEKGVLTEKLESQEKSLNTELTMLRKEKDELQLYSSQQIKLLHEDINTAKKQVTTLEEENLNLRTSLEIEVDMLNAEIVSLNETNNILKCEFSEKEKNLLELAEKKGNEEIYYGKLKVAESEMKLLSDEIATWKEQVNVLKEEKGVLKEKLESQLQSLNAELTVLKTEKDLLELSYSQKIDTLHQKLQVDGEELKSLVEELDEGKKQFRSLEQDKCNVEEVLRCKLELLTVENTSLKELNTRLKLEIAEREKKLLDNLKVKENELKVIEEELKTVHEEVASMKKQLAIFEQEKAVLTEKLESQEKSLNTELTMLRKEKDELQLYSSQQIKLLHEDINTAKEQLTTLEEENLNLRTSLEIEVDMLNAEIASLNETNNILKCEFSEKEKNLLELAEKKGNEENYYGKLKVAESEMKLLSDEIATWKEQIDVLKEEKDVLKEKLESQLQSLNAEITVLKTEKDLLELSYSQKIDTLHQKLQVDGEELKSLVEELDEGKKQFRSLEQDKYNVEEVLRCKLELLTVENTSLKELNTSLKLEIAEREKKLLDNLKVKENEVKVIEEELKTVHEEIASMKKQLAIFEQEKGVLTEKLESQEKSLNTELTMLRKEKDEMQLCSSQQIKLLHEDINTAKKQLTTLEEENLNLKTSLEIEVDLLNAEIASLNETNNILKCEFSEKKKNLLELAEKKGNEEIYYGKLKVAESEMKLLSDEIATWKEQVNVLKEEKGVLKEKLESQLQSLNAELTVLKTEKDLLELSYSQKIDTLHQKLQVDGEELKSLVEELDEGKKQFRSLEQDKCNVEEVLRSKLGLLTVENTSLKELNTRLKLEIAEREKKLLDNLKVKENELKVIEEELKTVHEEVASMKKLLAIFEQEKGVLMEKLESQEKSLNTELTMLRKEKDEMQLCSSQQIDSLYLEMQGDKDKLKLLHERLQEEKIHISKLKEEKINLKQFLESKLETSSKEIDSLKEIKTSLKLQITDKDEIIRELLNVKQSEKEYSDNLRLVEEELKSLRNVIESTSEQLAVLGEEKTVLCEKLNMQQKVLETELLTLQNERDSLKLQSGEKIRLAGEELAERKKHIGALEQDAHHLKECLEIAQKSFNTETALLQEKITILEVETAQGKEKMAELLTQRSCDKVSYEEQIYHLNLKLHLYTAKLKSLCSRLGSERQLISLEDNLNLDERFENYLEMLNIKLSAFRELVSCMEPDIQCKFEEEMRIEDEVISSSERNATLFSDKNKEHMLLQGNLEKECKFADLAEEKIELSEQVHSNEEHLCSDLGESVKVNKKQIESLNRNISQLKEANSILKREMLLEKQKLMQTLWNELQKVQQILGLQEEAELREFSFQKLTFLKELGSILNVTRNTDSICLVTENNLLSDVAASFQSSSDSFATATETLPYSNKNNALDFCVSNNRDSVVPHLSASESCKTEMTGSLCGAIENVKIPYALEDSSETANAILTSEKLKYCTVVSPTRDLCTELQSHLVSSGLTSDYASASSCNTGEGKIINYFCCDCPSLKNELAAAKTRVKKLEEEFDVYSKALTGEIKCLNLEWDGLESKNLNDLLRVLLNSVIQKQTEVFQSLEKEKCVCEKYSSMLQDFPKSYASFANKINREISLLNRMPLACESVILRMSTDMENKSLEILASVNEIDKLQTAFNLCKKDKINLLQKIDKLHTHVENLQVEQASKNRELEQLRNLLEEKQNSIDSLNSDLQNNLQKLEFLNKQIKEIAIGSEKNDFLQNQIKVQEKENAELNMIVASHKQKLIALTKELNDIFIRHVARTVECNRMFKENFCMAENERERDDIIMTEKKTSFILQEKLSCIDNVAESLDSAENVCNKLVTGTGCWMEADQKVQYLHEQLLRHQQELESKIGETRNHHKKFLTPSCELESELEKTFSSVYGTSQATQENEIQKFFNPSHEGAALLCVNTTLEERFAVSMSKIFNLQSAVRYELISKAQEESKVIQGLHEQLMQSENNIHILMLELEQSNKNVSSLCSEKKVLLGRIRQLELEELAGRESQSSVETAVKNEKQKEINCLKDEKVSLTAEIKELRCKLEETMEQYNVAVRQKTECCDGLSKQIKDLSNENSELYNKLKNVEYSLTSKCCTYIEKLTKCESEKLHLQECQTQNEAIMNSLQMEVQNALKKASDLDKENEDMLQYIQELQTNLKIMYDEQCLQNKAQNISAKELELAELKKENEALVTQVKEMKVCIEELEQQNHRLKLELGKLKDAKSIIDKQFQKLVAEHRRAFWHKNLTLTTVGTNTDVEENSGVACSCEMFKETMKNLQMELVHKKATILDLEFKMKSRARERDLEKCLQSYQEEVHTLREQLEIARVDQATCVALAARLQVQQGTPPKVEHNDIGVQVSLEDSSLRLSVVQEHNMMHLQRQVARLEEEKRLSHEVARLRLQEIEQVKKKNQHLLGIVSLCRCGYIVQPESPALAHNSEQVSASGSKTRHRR